MKKTSVHGTFETLVVKSELGRKVERIPVKIRLEQQNIYTKLA